MITGNELRQRFIDYFVKKLGHQHIQSSSLIPDNPTVLLTPAGMLQFVPIFLGYQEPPQPPRAATYQKCARAGGKDSDIENVGRTPRHHTFFEMLGNFSFGDYFKKEIIPWAWTFVTDELGLSEDKLWVTIYKDDDESFEIWKNDAKVPEHKIVRCGKKDNFWGPPGPTGPCGPCTEIHYDLGEDLKCGDNCQPGSCECDRWVEIWNLVLMELFQDEDGNHTPLTKKNVDTGMGLERIAMVCQNKRSTFETDLLMPILNKVCSITGKEYDKDPKTDVSLRIITDHARCVTFMVSDGLKPGNVGRNYVLRMILRRALRHGKILGVQGTFLHTIVDTVIENYKGAYPEIAEKRDKLVDIIKTEEERFAKTIDRGMGLLEKTIAKTQEDNNNLISGEEAFTLYDTFGFPLELTVEIAQEHGLNVDTKGFEKHMQDQKERAKQAHVTEKLTDDLVYVDITKQCGSTIFTGYNKTADSDVKVVKIIKDGQIVSSASEGDYVELILDTTCFYAESGGQIGDTGTITSDNSLNIDVINTTKFEGLFIHKCEIKEGDISEGNTVNIEVDQLRRANIALHHTATHLIHSALKKVLGDDVNQAGSMVASDRARFDFSYPKALSFDQLKQIESWVNKWILQNINHNTDVMTPKEAQNAGAVALFGEKYGDTVRVVSYGSVSKELCGGTHTSNTGNIHLCKIVSETALAAGVRRLEAVCGQYAIDYVNEHEKQVYTLCQKLKIPSEELIERIDKLFDELRSSDKKVQALNAELALSQVDSLLNNAVQLSNFKLLTGRLDNVDAKALKSAVDTLSDKLGNSIVVLGSVDSSAEKVTIIVKVTKDLIAEGYKAGDIANKVATICGGRGGGRPDFAQAGAKDVSKIDEALNQVNDIVKEVVKA
ncbi:MAG: alanine--tRNA ligase [Vampirovibrionia bacterium]